VASPASAQRNIPGQKTIQVTGGFLDGFSLRNKAKEYAFHGSLGVTRTNRNRSHWLLAVGYQQKDYRYREQIIPRVQFTGEVGYLIPILRDRGHNIAFTVGASALAGYESSNWGKKLLYDGATLTNRDGFVGGGALTAQLETYLSDRFVLLLNVKERALFGTRFGNFHTQLGIGLRIIIN
jgi:hypothetical protein